MTKKKIKTAAQKAANTLKAAISIFREPELQAAVSKALAASKKAAAERSAAGKAEKALSVMTDPTNLLAADLFLALLTRTPAKATK